MASLLKDWVALYYYYILWITGVKCLLFTGPVVLCPNPAKYCLQDSFNRVVEGMGCLGCQSGCQPGYMMTANPRYYVDTDDFGGHYLYHDIVINNNVNVSEPQWICDKGDSCQNGFYATKMGAIDSCSWCGEGCSTCTSYGNCQRCFLGYVLENHEIPGTSDNVTVCVHSNVSCPSPPSHCLHESYVVTGIGCVGCQMCEEGYMVSANYNYLNLSGSSSSSTTSGTYEYMGLEIHDGVNINEPRLICVAGYSCQDGWFSTLQGSSTVCAGCRTGCAQCSSKTMCSTCQDGYTLVHDVATNTDRCTAASIP